MAEATARAIVLGTLNFSRVLSKTDSIELLHRAHERGVRAINTADSDYSGRAEQYVGEFLASLPTGEEPWLMVELSGRDMGVPHAPNLTPEYLRRACERSLRRLRVDFVDVVVLPRPSFTIPLEETLEGVNELLVKPGLCGAVAVSTFPGWLTAHGQHLCRDLGLPPIASELAPLNVLDRRAENEILPNARFWGMEFYAWGVLAQGLLAGRYPRNGRCPPDSRATLLGGIYADRANAAGQVAGHRFVELAAAHGFEAAQAAIAWSLGRQGVTGVVVGPRYPAQIEAMVRASALELSEDFLMAVDRLNPPGCAVSDFFNSAPWMLETVQSN